MDYKVGVTELNRQVRQVKRTFIDPLTIAMWSINNDQIEAQINGIGQLPDVHYVGLYNEYEELLDDRGEKKGRSISRRIKIIHNIEGQGSHYLGHLDVMLSLDNLYAVLVEKAVYMLITETIKLFVLAFSFLLFFKILITRHLTNFGSFTKSLNLKNLDSPLLLDRKNRNDELDEVASAINSMRENIIHDSMEVDQYRSKLETLVAEQTEELERKAKEIKAMKKQMVAQEKLSSLGTIVAGVAHEVRNPINLINNSSIILRKICNDFGVIFDPFVDSLEVEQKRLFQSKRPLLDKTIGIISEQSKNVDNLVKSMLMTSRQGDDVKSDSLFGKIVSDSLTLSYHAMRSKFPIDVNVSFNDCDEISLLNCYPQDLSRLFLNMFDNAFHSLSDSMESKGDKFTPQLEVNITRKDDTANVEIRDNGVGISASIIDTLFEPFVTTRAPGKGTGLGLSIAYDIAKKHGGSISVSSKKGEFCKFVVSLPIENAIP